MIERVVDPTRYFLLLLDEGINGLGGVVVLCHGWGQKAKRNLTFRPHFIFSVVKMTKHRSDRFLTYGLPWTIQVGTHSVALKRSLCFAIISVHKSHYPDRKMRRTDAQRRFQALSRISDPWRRVSSVASVPSHPPPRILLLSHPRTIRTMLHSITITSPPYLPPNSPTCLQLNALKPSESLAWNPISRYILLTLRIQSISYLQFMCGPLLK